MVFINNELQSGLHERTGKRFEVERIGQTAIKARPAGFSHDTPGFSVLVERHSFRLRAHLKLDALAGQLVTAIRAGVSNNPGSVDAVERELKINGWKSGIQITDNVFVIEAIDNEEFVSEPAQLTEKTVAVISTLSEFVLNQYQITRAFDTRPARLRSTSDSSEEHPIWEYDPYERDKSTLRHRVLENWLIDQLHDNDLEPQDSVHGPQFDVGWSLNGSFVVCEVKSTQNNETKQIRLGLGQVLHYKFETKLTSKQDVKAALLVESEPEDSMLIELCRSVDVCLFWPTDSGIPGELINAN